MPSIPEPARRPLAVVGLGVALTLLLQGMLGDGSHRGLGISAVDQGGRTQGVLIGRGVTGGRELAGRLRVEDVGVGAGTLHPAGSIQVPFAVANPNPFPVEVVMVELTEVGGAPGCSSEYLQWSAAAQTMSVPVAARGRIGLTAGAMTLDADAPEACRGAEFPVTVSIRGTR